MPRIFSLLLMLLTVFVFPAPRPAVAGHDIITIQSVGAKPYDEAFNGFSAAFGTDVAIHRLILSDTDLGEGTDVIGADAPDLVFAIGKQALDHIKNIRNIPVVYAMVLDAPTDLGDKQITGVSMVIEPEKQMAILLEILPPTTRIGLLYDAERTGGLVDKIRVAAGVRGISLTARQIHRPKNVPLAGMEIMEKVDLFWMLPDLTVVKPENVEFLFLSAMESRTPVLTFSEKYVELGALFSIAVDPFDIGCQAGEMAARILAGTDVRTIHPENAREAITSINMKIARKLKITLDEKILKRARVIE